MKPTEDARFFALAARVIGRADREHPADAVLRAEFKAQQGLPRELSGEISRGVFRYYRWLGWLDRTAGLSDQLLQAIELAGRFARASEEFTEEELLARAIPAWAKAELDVGVGWLRALQAEPFLWLRARPGQGAAVAAELGYCTTLGPGLLSDTLAYRGGPDLFRAAAFHAGEFEVQDIHSQAVGWLCAPAPGECWWDACAGAGGKLLHLSALMRNKGLIWASDRSASRLEVLRRRAARARVFNYRSVIWKSGAALPTNALFDGVLLDAPCSSLGTWHRNPHARWTTLPSDVRELAAVQQELLAAVAAGVKPGGKLVYSVCTLTRAETDEVAAAFEARFPEFTPLPVANPFAPAQPPSPRQCLVPEGRSGNGMFVALWRRAP